MADEKVPECHAPPRGEVWRISYRGVWSSAYPDDYATEGEAYTALSKWNHKRGDAHFYEVVRYS